MFKRLCLLLVLGLLFGNLKSQTLVLNSNRQNWGIGLWYPVGSKINIGFNYNVPQLIKTSGSKKQLKPSEGFYMVNTFGNDVVGTGHYAEMSVNSLCLGASYKIQIPNYELNIIFMSGVLKYNTTHQDHLLIENPNKILHDLDSYWVLNKITSYNKYYLNTIIGASITKNRVLVGLNLEINTIQKITSKVTLGIKI
jgi:hypothetical protein